LEIFCAFAEALRSPNLLDSVRLSPTAFLRRRHLTFPKMLTLMLSGMCGGSLQQELDRFTANLQGSTMPLARSKAGCSVGYWPSLSRSMTSKIGSPS